MSCITFFVPKSDTNLFVRTFGYKKSKGDSLIFYLQGGLIRIIKILIYLKELLGTKNKGASLTFLFTRTDYKDYLNPDLFERAFGYKKSKGDSLIFYLQGGLIRIIKILIYL